MKITNINNIEKFFQLVDKCSGKVELVTNEGDRLNLKSKLSQYVSLANIFSSGTIPEMEIVAYEPEDTKRIKDMKGRPLLIFTHPWSIQTVLERNEGLKLSEFGNAEM